MDMKIESVVPQGFHRNARATRTDQPASAVQVLSPLFLRLTVEDELTVLPELGTTRVSALTARRPAWLTSPPRSSGRRVGRYSVQLRGAPTAQHGRFDGDFGAGAHRPKGSVPRSPNERFRGRHITRIRE